MSTSYTQKCPHCGNIVEGKIQRSTTSRAARNVLKKGGMKTALTLAGSVVPGFGNVAGFVAGTAIDAIWGDKINNAVDEAADIFVEDNKYSFCCPNCGHTWNCTEDSPLLEAELEKYQDELKRFYSFLKSYLDDEYSSMSIESRIAMFIQEAEDTSIPAIQTRYYRLAAVACLEAFCEEVRVRFKNYPNPDEQIKLQEICLLQGLECIDKCPYIDDGKEEENLIRASLSLLKDFWYDEEYNSAHYLETYGNIEEDYKDEEEDSMFSREWLLGMFGCSYELILNILSQQGEEEPESAVTNDAEQEYLDELKEVLADGEITPRERRLLEKIRVQLGISTERAQQLEQSVTSPALSEEELEYLNEYREIIADGEISARDQRFLDKLKKTNGISDQRALEIEKMA